MTNQLEGLTMSINKLSKLQAEEPPHLPVQAEIRAPDDCRFGEIINHSLEIKDMIQTLQNIPPTGIDQRKELEAALHPIAHMVKTLLAEISELKDCTTANAVFQGNSGLGTELAVTDIKDKIEELRKVFSNRQNTDYNNKEYHDNNTTPQPSVTKSSSPHKLTYAEATACDETIPKIERKQLPKAAKWWNTEIKEKKEIMIRLRRRIRNAHPTRKNWVIEQYLEARKQYKESIEDATTKSWKELCTNEQKENVWQRNYRILKVCSNVEEDKLLKDQNGAVLSEKGSATLRAETFYPKDNPNTDTKEQDEIRTKTNELIAQLENKALEVKTPFARTEIDQILSNMSPKKAPGGDANASSIWWGCKADDKRGTLLMETVAELNLEILNTGKSPTFSAYRMGSLCSSIIDITLCTSSLLHKIYNWRIDDSFGTISNHKPILFNLAISNKPQQRKINNTRKFNTRNADWNSFRTELEKVIDTKGITKESKKRRTIENLDKTVVDYTECIMEACSKTIPTIKRKQISKAAKWWNAELKEKKDEMIRIRRRIKNAHPRRRDHVIQQYLIAKEDYTTSIERASTKSWKDLCNKEEKETIWQRTYRILKISTNREEDKLLRDQNGEILSAKQSAVLLAETFYPKDSCNTDTEEQSEIREKARAAEAKEVLKTLSKTEDIAESDIDSGDTNTSLNTSTRSIGGNRMLLNDLPRHANEVLQRTKAELEKSGNLKREIRESVVSGIYTLYEMVLKLYDSRILHILESSTQKLNVSGESERLTQRHAGFMHETLGQYANLKENVEKLLKETESTRSIVSYDLCEAVTATKNEIVNVRKEITLGSSISSQIQFLMEELKQLRANTDTLKNPTCQEIDLSRFAEELQELRQAVRELTKDRVIPQSQNGEHSPEIPNQEMLSEKHHKKLIEELQDHISEIKAQIIAKVAELRHEILKITRDIKGITDTSFNSQLPSVQANWKN
ncbi:unnamed protein product [Parnassius apollo]|uniref:(apollo) hypothetical protein n=1 Tax=Parnassius apollo TaxID=110799 RepID=A0A8S3XK88_PARAO|nr:unnamed protein product [Parnassius apollo]